MTDFCTDCKHVVKVEKSAYSWLCDLFPQDRYGPDGRPLDPYYRCTKVLTITKAYDAALCSLFEREREQKEPIVKETISGKSVTFQEKEKA